MNASVLLWIAGVLLILFVFLINQWRVARLEDRGYWVPESYRNAWLVFGILVLLALLFLPRFIVQTD